MLFHYMFGKLMLHRLFEIYIIVKYSSRANTLPESTNGGKSSTPSVNMSGRSFPVTDVAIVVCKTGFEVSCLI